MSEEVTPVVPQAPAATPPTPTVETVSLSKEEHAQLVRNAARAAEAQSRADRLEKMLSKRSGTHFNNQAQATPPSQEDLDAKASAEDYKAERALMALAADPAYRDILDADPTLRDLLIKNPLAVLPMMAADALDAEDAINLVKENLGRRKPAAAAPATPPAPAPVELPVPPTGGVNPQDRPTDAEYESAKANKNVENAIAGMVKVGMKRMKGGI